MTSSYENGDAHDIWEALFSGARLQLSFPSEKEAERLRIRLYQIKKARETRYISLGYMNADEAQSLIWEPQKIEGGDPKLEVAYIAYLGKRKRESKRYMFKIIEEAESV